MQAAPCSQDRAVAIGFDRAAFERPVDALVRGRAEQAAFDQRFDQAIVAIRAVFAAPAGETEIEQPKTGAVGERDRSRITKPRVVVVGLDKTDAFGGRARDIESARDMLAQRDIGDTDDEVLETRDRAGEASVSGLDLGKARRPIGGFMRPSNDHPGLRFPFRRQAKSRGTHSFQILGGSAAESTTLWMTRLRSKYTV